MTEEKGMGVKRIIEQPSDAISFYCELGQVVKTENEVMLQLYETIPGPLNEIGDDARYVTTRLRASITFSHKHAKTLGKTLIEKTGEE